MSTREKEFMEFVEDEFDKMWTKKTKDTDNQGMIHIDDCSEYYKEEILKLAKKFIEKFNIIRKYEE